MTLIFIHALPFDPQSRLQLWESITKKFNKTEQNRKNDAKKTYKKKFKKSTDYYILGGTSI